METVSRELHTSHVTLGKASVGLSGQRACIRYELAPRESVQCAVDASDRRCYTACNSNSGHSANVTKCVTVTLFAKSVSMAH